MVKHALAVMVGLALGLVVSAVLVLALDERSGPAIIIDDPRADETIVVAVVGAVASPGVVTLPADARLHDAITAAGGLDADADLAQINPASRLQDEARVVVPRVGEAAHAVTPSTAALVPSPAANGSEIGALAITQAAATPSVARLSDGALADTININTASAADLEALPEIGPARAQAIVEYRTTHGAFRSIDELANVPNISPRMVEEMRTLISVEP